MTSPTIRISIVVAAADNSVIGANGDLAWRIADDLKWFKKNTLGKPIIMGRKTYASIGKPLPGRANIVVTRQCGLTIEGVHVVHSLDAAIELASSIAVEDDGDEVCIIGGGELYAAALPITDRIYLSRVDAKVDGDTHFPELDLSEWRESAVGNCEKSAKNDHDCEFFILDRIRPDCGKS